MDETAGDTGNEQLVVELELDRVLERLLLGGKHAVELLGLWDCTWEAVKDETVGTISMELGRESYCHLTPMSMLPIR